jgi:hypothetical protein
MRRAIIYWVVGTAVVVFGIAGQQDLFKTATRVPQQPAENLAHARPSSSSEVLPAKNGSSRSANSLPEEPRQAARGFGENVLKPATNGAKSQTSSTSIDKSVIGVPFPISTSVDIGCQKFPSCDEMRKRLSELANEPRDSAWATEMESLIQNNVMSQGPDKYSIRDVECRSSLCSVETASPFGVFTPRYPDPLYGSLTGGGVASIWGSETDESGGRIIVTVTIFMRR